MQTVQNTAWQSMAEEQVLQCGAILEDWLRTSGSMTERLLKASGYNLQVKVLRQAWLAITEDEAQTLGIADDELALVRETLLCNGEQPWIFARSVFPKKLFCGSEQYLAQQLDTTPIGKILYRHEAMQRSPLMFTSFEIGDEEYQRALQYSQFHPEKLWARRAIFFLHQKPLLVSEYFLPEIEAQ